MTDILTKAQRSALMAKVKGWGNASTELRLVVVFRALGVTDRRRRAAHCDCGDRIPAWLSRHVVRNPGAQTPEARQQVEIGGLRDPQASGGH